MTILEMREGYIVQMVLPILAGWILALLLGRPAIPMLHRIHFDQTEREEGLESHKKKNGTPTMGGLIFVLPMAAVTILCMVFLGNAKELGAVLIPTLGFGLIGFADDYLKVAHHHNLGLRAWQKLALQFAVTALFGLYLHFGAVGAPLSEGVIPFASGAALRLGWLSVPALVFVALATTNGTNLTDGVDGLCASVTVPVALFFGAAALVTGGPGAPAAGAMAGALLGYLFYNYYPAKVFMGDTGSLAIGGFVVGISYLMGLEFFIPVVGLVYAVEVISVVLQVSYFKATGGKRLFRMSPIHHHFEKGGWSETRVVGTFMTVTLIMCLIGLAGLG